MNASTGELAASSDQRSSLPSAPVTSTEADSPSLPQSTAATTANEGPHNVAKDLSETPAGRSFEDTQPGLEDDKLDTKTQARALAAAGSTAEPIPAASKSQENAANWLREAFDKYKTITKLHHKFFGAQTRLNAERDAVDPKLDNLERTLGEISQLLEQVDQFQSTELDQGVWKRARDQFSAARQSFRNQVHAVDNREQRLGRLVSKLAKLEPEFLQVMDAYFKGAKLGFDEASSSRSSRSRSPSWVLEPHSPRPESEDGELGVKEFGAPSYLPRNAHGMLPEFLRDIDWTEKRQQIEDLVKIDGKRELIEDWVGKIPRSKGGLAPEPFEHEISSAKSEPEWGYIQFTGDITADYVIVQSDMEFAPNGRAPEPRPGLLQSMLRKTVSDSDLNAAFRQVSKPSSRGSRQMYRSPEVE